MFRSVNLQSTSFSMFRSFLHSEGDRILAWKLYCQCFLLPCCSTAEANILSAGAFFWWVAVCDPKSLLFLFGMQLDYSDALIGGGFSFSNPNASSTCGCGKSFAA
jgi:hypothetical protein